MKKIKIIYWISTGLFAAFMFITAIPYVISGKDVIQLLHDQLGYPLYIIPSFSTAKIILDSYELKNGLMQVPRPWRVSSTDIGVVILS